MCGRPWPQLPVRRQGAGRPGRVDHAALLPLPDAGARAPLIRLCPGNLEAGLAGPETVICRAEGVTASLVKELPRRAALFADGAGGPAGQGAAGGRLAARANCRQAGGSGSGANQDKGPSAGRRRPLRVINVHLNSVPAQLPGARIWNSGCCPAGPGQGAGRPYGSRDARAPAWLAGCSAADWPAACGA
jgi:hypothetical protein